MGEHWRAEFYTYTYTVRQASEAHSVIGAAGSNVSEKDMQLLLSDSRQELTAALLD